MKIYNKTPLLLFLFQGITPSINPESIVHTRQNLEDLEDYFTTGKKPRNNGWSKDGWSLENIYESIFSNKETPLLSIKEMISDQYFIQEISFKPSNIQTMQLEYILSFIINHKTILYLDLKKEIINILITVLPSQTVFKILEMSKHPILNELYQKILSFATIMDLQEYYKDPKLKPNTILSANTILKDEARKPFITFPTEFIKKISDIIKNQEPIDQELLKKTIPELSNNKAFINWSINLNKTLYPIQLFSEKENPEHLKKLSFYLANDKNNQANPNLLLLSKALAEKFTKDLPQRRLRRLNSLFNLKDF